MSGLWDVFVETELMGMPELCTVLYNYNVNPATGKTYATNDLAANELIRNGQYTQLAMDLFALILNIPGGTSADKINREQAQVYFSMCSPNFIRFVRANGILAPSDTRPLLPTQEQVDYLAQVYGLNPRSDGGPFTPLDIINPRELMNSLRPGLDTIPEDVYTPARMSTPSRMVTPMPSATPSRMSTPMPVATPRQSTSVPPPSATPRGGYRKSRRNNNRQKRVSRGRASKRSRRNN